MWHTALLLSAAAAPALCGFEILYFHKSESRTPLVFLMGLSQGSSLSVHGRLPQQSQGAEVSPLPSLLSLHLPPPHLSSFSFSRKFISVVTVDSFLPVATRPLVLVCFVLCCCLLFSCTLLTPPQGRCRPPSCVPAQGSCHLSLTAWHLGWTREEVGTCWLS